MSDKNNTECVLTDAQEASVRNDLIRCVVSLTRGKEFYAHIIQQFERVYVNSSHQVQTAAVGRNPGERFIKLYLNTSFFKKVLSSGDRSLCLDKVVGVLEHEVSHIVFGHLFLKFTDRVRGNVAVDLVVNSYIDRDRLPPNCCFPEDYDLESGKSALWYYTKLRDNDKFKEQCSDGSFGLEGIMSNIESSHSKWGDIVDDPIAKEFAKDIIRKSKETCRGSYGDIHGDIVAQIDNILKTSKPIVPWGKVLRTFVASCSESSLDYTMKRISKRFNCRPGTRKEDVLNVAVAIDTSGSISEDNLNIFFNEIKWIWKNGCTVTIYEADCKVCLQYPFKGKFNGKVHGRGGTDLEPVLIEVDKKGYDALIYFTDFYAPVIEKQYKTPALWVLTSEIDRSNYPVKSGHHIRIGDGIVRGA